MSDTLLRRHTPPLKRFLMNDCVAFTWGVRVLCHFKTLPPPPEARAVVCGLLVPFGGSGDPRDVCSYRGLWQRPDRVQFSLRQGIQKLFSVPPSPPAASDFPVDVFLLHIGMPPSAPLAVLSCSWPGDISVTLRLSFRVAQACPKLPATLDIYAHCGSLSLHHLSASLFPLLAECKSESDSSFCVSSIESSAWYSVDTM